MTRGNRRRRRPNMTREPAELPQDVHDLLTMFTYKRHSGGATEMAFIRRFLHPLGVKIDPYGNHWLRIGESPILFSSHTDTVHRTEGTQLIYYGDQFASTSEKCEVLGADCGTGVWLMREMIQARIPGVYVFHTDEEIGGHGSAYIRDELKGELDGLKFAIAFDRMGTDEIITHQLSKRCCSEAFATSLAEVLKPLEYKGSRGGYFTDTANYTQIIPECTNIGVGYYKQHTKGECQDIAHALALRDSLIRADWSKLVAERDPTVAIVGWNHGRRWQESEVPKWWADYQKPEAETDEEAFAKFVKKNASDIADFLNMIGYSQKDMEAFIAYGTVP